MVTLRENGQPRHPGGIGLLIAALALASQPGCADDAGEGSAAEQSDGDVLSASVSDYLAGSLTPVGPGALPSAAAEGLFFRVWARPSVIPEYVTEVAEGAPALRPGDFLVRELLDQGGNDVRLTVLVKRAPGYNSDCGDFMFGVTSPEGTIVDEDGAPLVGRLSACENCHMGRAKNGFLFGVP